MKQKAYDFLRAHNIPFRVVEHKATFHVHEHPKELEGLPVVKNLLLKDVKTKQVYMVILLGEKRLDMRKLGEALGVSRSRLTFIQHDDVERVVGVKPGHVSILNLLNDEAKNVEVVYDEELETLPEVGFHPNENTATVLFASKYIDTILRTVGVTFTATSL